MISEQAKSSLDRLFRATITRHVREISEQDCTVESVSDSSEITEEEFALITLSSSVFKCLGVFHLNHTEQAIRFFKGMSSTAMDIFGQNEFRDSFLEFCNLCCGTLNRELHQYFPHLGMSTPYFLVRECSPFMPELNPGYSKDYRIILDSSFILHVSLYVCDFGAVDFTAHYSDNMEDTGELEMF